MLLAGGVATVAYTAWVTNWLDPARIPVRPALLVPMLVSLVMSALLRIRRLGLLVGVAYAVMQIGRSLFTVWALRGQPLLRNYQRILAWSCISGALAVAGGLAAPCSRGRPAGQRRLPGTRRRDSLLDSAAGLPSTTAEWDIEGGHFAERCQAFILIALGESIVVIGATLAGLLGPLAAPRAIRAPVIAAFLVAFAGSVGLWWLYFDRSAGDAARLIAESADPGFYRPVGVPLHPPADHVRHHCGRRGRAGPGGPDVVGAADTSWLILGGGRSCIWPGTWRSS